jgi:outer membrane biosynthesis protein TonB
MSKIFHYITVLSFFIIFQACQTDNSSSSNEENNITETQTNVEENIDTIIEIEPNIEENVEEEIETVTKVNTETNTSKTSNNTTTKAEPKIVSKPKSEKPAPQPTKPSAIFKKKTETQPKPAGAKPKTTKPTTQQPIKKSEDVVVKKKPTQPKQPVVSKPPLSHEVWNNLLQKYVSSSGKVNYAGIKKEHNRLTSYLNILEVNPPQSSWSRNKQIAYWINAYNAHTVDLIVKNYPISSILKLDGGKTWYVKRIKIGDKKYSLDDIEKKILIGKFKEPRIHFAVNCAAKSCPPLMNKAWKASTLNADLERMTRNFINDSNNNSFSKRSAKLSKIFEWYAADFGNSKTFINKYALMPITRKMKVSYNDYNWDLNN